MAFMINNIDGGPISALPQQPKPNIGIESVDGQNTQGGPADPAEPGDPIEPGDPLKKRPTRDMVMDQMQEIAKQQHEAQEANDLLRAILNRV